MHTSAVSSPLLAARREAVVSSWDHSVQKVTRQAGLKSVTFATCFVRTTHDSVNCYLLALAAQVSDVSVVNVPGRTFAACIRQLWRLRADAAVARRVVRRLDPTFAEVELVPQRSRRLPVFWIAARLQRTDHNHIMNAFECS